MEKNKKVPVWVWIFGVGVCIALVSDANPGTWGILGLALLAFFIFRPKATLTATRPSETIRASATNVLSQEHSSATHSIDQNKIKDRETAEVNSYQIPPPPKNLSIEDGAWVSDAAVEIAGFHITGGMIYVGSKLKDSQGFTDPALIDPKKSVANTGGDFTENQTGYWPSYSQITPTARRAFLRWLSEGRKHPDADIGLVFLYFYGLERRVIIDAVSDPKAAADKPRIIAELKRLIDIYGVKSGSFLNYSSKLLQFLELSEASGKLYEGPLPDLTNTFEFPIYLRLALGQSAADGVPIPFRLALAWVEHDPAISKRTPVTRCQSAFSKLFEIKYRQKYEQGMKLAVNRTKLKFTYFPASAALRQMSQGIKLDFGDIPDVTALTAPINKLQEIVDACTSDIEAYSRFVGRNPDKRNTLDGLLQLPVQLWPDASRDILNKLKEQVIEGMIVMTFGELLASFKSPGLVTRENILGFAKALETEEICIEPDVLGGAKRPKAEDNVVLFYGNAFLVELRKTTAYQLALVTLELAAGVASSDGDFSRAELEHLNSNIDTWLHLTPSNQQRLKAHVRLLAISPVSLSTFKKKIEPLDKSAREAIASFAATLALADGVVLPDEIKFLEKIYKLLGIDAKRVFGDVHTATVSGNAAMTKPAGAGAGLGLNTDRIAALQQDTASLSALLSDIFKEEEPSVPMPDETENVSDEGLMLGLDRSHSSFVRILISRPRWMRVELNDLALDLDLMLDGALERVNEAALDMFDVPFTEGDDPVEIHPEIVDRISQ